MRAIILAAGMGKRMGDLTKDRPKCLVPLLGKPLIERQLKVLREVGIEDIVLVGGYRAEKLNAFNLPLIINDRYGETNMVSTLFCAEKKLQPGKELLIAYSDIVYEKRVLKSILQCRGPLCVVIDSNWREYWSLRMDNPLDDAETLKLTAQNRIIELGKKAKSYNDIEGQYIGLIKVSGEYVLPFRQAWHDMDRDALYDGKNFDNMYMTSYLQQLINSGWEAQAVPVENGWLEIDTLKDLELYERMENDGSLARFYRA